MTTDADDLESLFDEGAAQRVENISKTDSPAAGTSNDIAANLASAVASVSDAALDSGAQTQDEIDAAVEAFHKQAMFDRLGGITRTLHDSLRSLGLDRSLSDAQEKIRHSEDRLEYIAELTEQAANKTLNAIDVGIPEQDALAKSARLMEARWAALFEGQMPIEEFKQLAADSKQFSSAVALSCDAEKARLLDIMMAQDFQDITGQLIKKIVVITKQLESELARLLRDNAPHEIKSAQSSAPDAQAVDLLYGPSTPNVAMEQDDVDNLLADLGF